MHALQITRGRFTANAIANQSCRTKASSSNEIQLSNVSLLGDSLRPRMRSRANNVFSAMVVSTIAFRHLSSDSSQPQVSPCDCFHHVHRNTGAEG